MKNKTTISKNVNKDVVLCETTSRIVSSRASSKLLESSIPFSRYLKRVPFFKRHHYNGASEVYVISTNRTQYGNARRALFAMDERDYRRLLLNII